mgnify:CR=1 FL=1
MATENGSATTIVDRWAFRQVFLEHLHGAALGRIVQLGAGGAGAATAQHACDRMLGVHELIVESSTIHERARSPAARLATTFSRHVSAEDDPRGGGCGCAEPTDLSTPPRRGCPDILAFAVPTLRFFAPDLWVAGSRRTSLPILNCCRWRAEDRMSNAQRGRDGGVSGRRSLSVVHRLPGRIPRGCADTSNRSTRLEGRSSLTSSHPPCQGATRITHASGDSRADFRGGRDRSYLGPGRSWYRGAVRYKRQFSLRARR